MLRYVERIRKAPDHLVSDDATRLEGLHCRRESHNERLRPIIEGTLWHLHIKVIKAEVGNVDLSAEQLRGIKDGCARHCGDGGTEQSVLYIAEVVQLSIDCEELSLNILQ